MFFSNDLTMPWAFTKKLLYFYMQALQIIESTCGVSSRLLQSRLNTSSSFNNCLEKSFLTAHHSSPERTAFVSISSPDLVPESHEILHRWANQWWVSGEANNFLFSSVLPLPPTFPIFIPWINPCISLSKPGHLGESPHCHYDTSSVIMNESGPEEHASIYPEG